MATAQEARMLKKFVDGAVRPNSRKPGRTIEGIVPRSKPKISVKIEAGTLYRLRRGSHCWFTWGDCAMLAMTTGTFTKGSYVQVMAPSGLVTVSVGDLRPIHGEFTEEE